MVTITGSCMVLVLSAALVQVHGVHMRQTVWHNPVAAKEEEADAGGSLQRDYEADVHPEQDPFDPEEAQPEPDETAPAEQEETLPDDEPVENEIEDDAIMGRFEAAERKLATDLQKMAAASDEQESEKELQDMDQQEYESAMSQLDAESVDSPLASGPLDRLLNKEDDDELKKTAKDYEGIPLDPRPVYPGSNEWSKVDSRNFRGRVRNAQGKTIPSFRRAFKRFNTDDAITTGAFEELTGGTNWAHDLEPDSRDHPFLGRIPTGALNGNKFCDDHEHVRSVSEGCEPIECYTGQAMYCSEMHRTCKSEWCRKKIDEERVYLGACLTVYKHWDAEMGRGPWCKAFDEVHYPPPVDCEVGSWSWGTCSRTCGGGSKLGTRQVTVVPLHGGKECPALTTSRPCNTQKCVCKAGWVNVGGMCFLTGPIVQGGDAAQAWCKKKGLDMGMFTKDVQWKSMSQRDSKLRQLSKTGTGYWLGVQQTKPRSGQFKRVLDGSMMTNAEVNTVLDPRMDTRRSTPYYPDWLWMRCWHGSRFLSGRKTYSAQVLCQKPPS